MSRPYLAILGSGKGSNLQAIAQAIQQGRLEAEIKIVLSDVAESGFLQKAQRLNLPHYFLEPFEAKASEILIQAQIDLIILAGFMKILSPSFLQAFPQRILNIHPSLLPKYPGKEAWKQAWINQEQETGCTVHVVTEQTDQGPILGQRSVILQSGESCEDLYRRIQAEEHRLYPEMIANYWKALNC